VNSQTLHTVALWACRLAGFALIYAALFLTEDEEGRVQNRLELWLTALRHQQDVSVSYAVRLMRAVADIEKRGFDKVFGEKLLSVRSVLTSVCLSIMVVTISEAILDLAAANHTLDNTNRYYTVMIPLSALCLMVMLGMHAATSTRTHILLGAVTLMGIFTASAYFWDGRPGRGLVPEISTEDLTYMSAYLRILAASSACDLVFILFTRFVMNKISELDKPLNIIALIASNVAVGAFISGIYFRDLWIAITSPDILYNVRLNTGGYIDYLSETNALDGFICLLWVFMLAVILLHRLFWPSLWRLLYSLKRFKVIQNKKLLWATAMVLLVGPAKGVSFVSWVVDKVSKAG
jgi:hypothetical protein